ncbi:MAG: HD-GYP domain-containing protein [Rhodocyclaceae bacterium]|nr:MAG: HD-GYP domain-containing protein [Rhodocyclaceae bacterium]
MNTVQLLLKSLFALASMVEARDPYTGGHLWRVSQFSRLLAENAGLPASDVARIMVGGFLHDLGKIAVPDAILNKPDRLSDTEYAVIMTHPDVGHRLLADHPLADLALAAVHAHHERPDGAGYPRRLASADIPLDARIVGITDAFDAMTSTRPYRKGMPIPKALTIIEENLGSQFDSEWGRRFIVLGSCGELEHIVGHSEPGIPLQECPACGPIVVINRHHEEGSLVYCRHCSGELKVSGSGPTLALTPTGQRGQPDVLEPSVDHELFAELVSLAEACLTQAN